MWLLVSFALAACATAQPVGSDGSGDADEGPAVSFEEACQDESSLLALCAGQQCGMYRCREVMKHLTVGQVVRTWAEVEPLAGVGEGAQRNWGSAQELPWDSRPVFIIPWSPRPLLPSQQKELEATAEERNKPHERHHIFPQAFREWFTAQGVNIDEYVILLEVEKHRSIHRGANGGPWNAAWYQFIISHREAKPEEIYRFAGQLIYEFQLFGPVVPYWRQPIRPMPPGY
jgi:uncharacterized lipoprotein (TIGR02269 family)